jgi:hypothetical protein
MGCNRSMLEGKSYCESPVKEERANAPVVKDAVPRKFLLLNLLFMF